MPAKKSALETATFAAGCFWGVEDIFRNTAGVKDTLAGYSGGHTKNPAYKEVCTGNTGHAESVQVIFDPSDISYEKLLDLFWGLHDPTTRNRQGPDVGSQYRSVIFFHSEEQGRLARKSKEKLEKSGKFSRKIVTEIVSAGPFFRAEEYHQQYLRKNGLSTCHI